MTSASEAFNAADAKSEQAIVERLRAFIYSGGIGCCDLNEATRLVETAKRIRILDAQLEHMGRMRVHMQRMEDLHGELVSWVKSIANDLAAK